MCLPPPPERKLYESTELICTVCHLIRSAWNSCSHSRFSKGYAKNTWLLTDKKEKEKSFIMPLR